MNNNERISNQHIIHGILEKIRESGCDRFTARPWNFYAPNTTLWWLVPSTEWPALKCAKLVLFRSETGYRVGIHIEKGISEVAGQMLSATKAKSLCIRPDWAWNVLLRDLSVGKFEEKLMELSDEADRPIRISLQASSITSEYDPYAEEIEGLETDNIMVLEFKHGTISMQDDELKGEMQNFGGVCNFADLIRVLSEKELDWFWIDMFVVFDVKIEEHHQISTLALSFYKKFMELFGLVKR